MKYFYSPNTRGFYISSVNSEIPTDAIELTKVEYEALRDGQSEGKVITVSKDGKSLISN